MTVTYQKVEQPKYYEKTGKKAKKALNLAKLTQTMIGIFDSGYGGLTVLKPILDLLPQYDYIYLGDNARAPYGNHSEENIKIFSEQAVEFLFSRGVKLIIFACNTASAVALRQVQRKYDGKILGVLIPVAERAVELNHGGGVGVVATRATVKSQSYPAEIAKLNPQIKVYSKACPLLVPLIEEDWHHKPEAVSILKKYLRQLKGNNLESLILGCTHYPLMEKHFRRIMGKKVEILNSGRITAEKLADYLQRHPEIERQIGKNSERHFLTSDDPQTFKNFTEKHFGLKITLPEKIKLA